MILLFLISIPFYFLPAFIAWSRGHKNGLAIFVLCLFTGWTLVGWIAAFIWACVGESTPKVRSYNPDTDWDRSAIYGAPAPERVPLADKLSSEPIFKD